MGNERRRGFKANGIHKWWASLYDSKVRFKTIEALGKIGDVRAVVPLIQRLKDKNTVIRIKAIEVLGELGDARAADPLIRIQKDQKDYYFQ